MEITLLQGILITLLVMILVVDRHLEVFFWFRPIIVCPLVGLLLNDLNLEYDYSKLDGVHNLYIPLKFFVK